MTANELRKKYIEFFKSKGHTQISGQSLIPENDPSVLFTTAGMHPLVPYLLGEPHPAGTRLTDYQKCIRTGDIDEVGDESHLTFFEMLGNWSLGDYFKKESIAFSYEFLTSKEWLGIDKNKLSVTVFKGDEDAPRDDFAAKCWEDNGIPRERIAFLPKSDNWWAAGPTGPCGPDTEIFYYVGEGEPAPNSNKETDTKNWLEIWNNVFMEYNRTASGELLKLPKQNVDTGMGLERTNCILQGKTSVYQTETFTPILNEIAKIANKRYGEDEDCDRSFRIIADHTRAAVFILGDQKGVTPDRVGAPYVLRRLIRRAVRHGMKLGIEQNFLSEIAKVVIKDFGDVYNELRENENKVYDELTAEEERFRKTLTKGEAEFQKILKKMGVTGDDNDAIKATEADCFGPKGPRNDENENSTLDNNKARSRVISGRVAYNLYETYGYPLELTQEVAKENGLLVDVDGFFDAQKKHQALSKAAQGDVAKGGLAEQSEIATKYHTATHLLQQALVEVLGDHVAQKGSNINSERLRFDFTFERAMTADEVKKAQDIVNEKIKEDLPVTMEVMTLEEAKAAGARALFVNKYGEQVKVYTIGKSPSDYFSKEVCGGPHVTHTGAIGNFKIVKEQSSSSGVRRIRAVIS